MEDIIAPIDRELLKSELTAERRLRSTNKSHNEIYIVNWKNAPNVLKEIGRLREIAFRAAGGGTGLSMDIDEYDTIYLGYPNWWSTMPTIVMTFLESYDFTINISILFVHMKEVVWEEVKVILKNFVQTVSFIKD